MGARSFRAMPARGSSSSKILEGEANAHSRATLARSPPERDSLESNFWIREASMKSCKREEGSRSSIFFRMFFGGSSKSWDMRKIPSGLAVSGRLISPWFHSSRWAMSRSSVVLPEPFCPFRSTGCFAFQLRLRFR